MRKRRAILDRALGKPKVMEDDKQDDFAHRVQAMTREERLEEARRILEDARRYLPLNPEPLAEPVNAEPTELHVGSGGTRKRDV